MTFGKMPFLIFLLLLSSSFRAWPQVPAAAASITGTIVDQTGSVIAGAKVTLMGPTPEEVLSDADGRYSFLNAASGPFHLSVSAPSFATQVTSGVLHPGEALQFPHVVLTLAMATADVQVRLSREEMAEVEIKDEEKQRVLGFIPNFNVTYAQNAAPLTSKQKFELAWKSVIDPFSFGVTALIAGVQQSQNDFRGYGQGAQGYGKRYGAAYADFFVGSMVGGAILPSLLRQDPRYFYKGTGTAKSRFLYALANAFICKGDNGHWQPNYSSILGSLAAGGISNLYYPSDNRNGARLVIENGAIGIAATAGSNVIQEFLLRKLTPNQSGHKALKN